MVWEKCVNRKKQNWNITSVILDNGVFLLQFLKHPYTVGSVCPSGAALTKQLLTGISLGEQGLVIDLGSGSGSVSECMVSLGIAKDRILAIEALGKFKEPFSARCPDIPIVIGDARNLKAILDKEAPGREICTIVSSLPFRTMSPALTKGIMEEIHRVLRDRGGRLVQYSYAWWMRFPLQQYGFIPDSAAIVWKNLPPARVESYGPALWSPAVTPGAPGGCLPALLAASPETARVQSGERRVSREKPGGRGDQKI